MSTAASPVIGDRLTPKDYAFFEERWVTASIADQAGIRRVTSQVGQEMFGRKRGDCAGLVIPYVAPWDDNHIRDYRLRLDHPPLEERADGSLRETRKYIQPPGRPNMVYFPPGATMQMLEDVGLQLMIAEGECKSLAALRLASYNADAPRFLPVAVSGVYNFRGVIGKTAGPNGDRRDVKGLLPDLTRIALKGRQVIIAYDADAGSNPRVRSARRQLSRALIERGAIVGILEWSNEEGKGIDDWIVKVGPEKVLSAIGNVAFGDKKTTRGFVHNDGRIYWIDQEADVRIFVCSELRVAASTCDPDGEFWGRLLVWHDGHGREHRLAIPMELFAGEGVALREILLNGGLEIGSGKRSRELLSQYIQDEHPERSCTCVSRIGWHGATFVFPGNAIPQTDSVLFQSKERIDHAWRTAGVLGAWKMRIGALCVGNSRLAFGASMGFAAPLLEPMKVEGGGVHFVGDTSTGKTTVQTTAASVCGGGGRGFIRSWRATSNALESVGELHNHGLLTLDELSEMPDPAQVNATVYMLSNGQGKARATGSAALRPTRSWRLLYLSSGEITLSEHAQAGRVRTKGGGEVRLLNVPADAGAGHGIFENLHGAPSAREFADALKAAAAEVYGTPLRAFLETWAADWDANCAKVKQAMDKFLTDAMNEILSDATDTSVAPEIGRALRRIGLVAAAGEQASAWGITGWPEGEARDAALRIAKDWIEARGGIGQADVEAGIREVRRFIATKAMTHFQSLERRYDNSGNPVVERILERAGFWQEDEKGNRIYLIFPEVFRTQICCGHNSRSILRELEKRNLLIRGEGKHLSRYETIPAEGRARFYAIRARILEGAAE